jgi:hypothetical protein
MVSPGRSIDGPGAGDRGAARADPLVGVALPEPAGAARVSVLAASTRNLPGFRNVVAHGHGRVDLRIVRDVVDNRLDDLLHFCGAIGDRLDRDG